MTQPDRRPAAACPYRTLFLSDLHLGALGARPDLVLAFLQAHRAETYVLVGDILDLWHPLLPHWSAADQAVIDHLVARKAEGARILYLRGNHDPFPDRAPQHCRVPAEAQEALIHTTADGRRYLVLHGDACDGRLFRAHIFTRLGSRIDHGLRRFERLLTRRRPDTPPEARSAVDMLLTSINALLYLGRAHERKVLRLARRKQVDGVICGHFHIAGLHDDFGLTYANCGDWIDSLTALAETADGSLRLLDARKAPALLPGRAAAEPEFAGA